MKALFLHKDWQQQGNQVVGQMLYSKLQAISEASHFGYAVCPDHQIEKQPASVQKKLIQSSVVERLVPDIIYIEGGLFGNLATENLLAGQEKWRIPRTLVSQLVANGSTLIVAGANQDDLSENKAGYRAAGTLLNAFVDYGPEDDRYVVYGIDQQTSAKGGYRFFYERMHVSESLNPCYEGVSEILVSGSPVRLAAWQHILATGNRSTTGSYHSDLRIYSNDICPFASIGQFGSGTVCFIAASVFHDTILERHPDNARWFTNICSFLNRKPFRPW